MHRHCAKCWLTRHSALDPQGLSVKQGLMQSLFRQARSSGQSGSVLHPMAMQPEDGRMECLGNNEIFLSNYNVKLLYVYLMR